MNNFFLRLVSMTSAQLVAFALVGTGLFYFLIYDNGSALESEMSNLRTQIAAETKKKKETDEVLQQEVQMKTTVGELSQKYQEISRRLPTSLTSIDLNRSIDAFARNANVSIKSRRPLPTVAGEIVDEVPIEVSLEGAYGDLAQFVYFLTISERATAIRSFQVTIDSRSSKLKFDGVVVGYQLASAKPDPKKLPPRRVPPKAGG